MSVFSRNKLVKNLYYKTDRRNNRSAGPTHLFKRIKDRVKDWEERNKRLREARARLQALWEHPRLIGLRSTILAHARAFLRRIMPMLSFSLLCPVFFLMLVIHEIGHAIVAVALGGQVMEIGVYQYGMSVLPVFDRQLDPLGLSIFFIAGWLAQYVVGVMAFLAMGRLKKRGFLVNSIALWAIIQNLIVPSMSLGSLRGDSLGLTTTLMNASKIEAIPIFTQILALSLLVVTSYISGRETEAFIRNLFPTMATARTRPLAALVVVYYVAISTVCFFALSPYPQYFLAIVVAITTISFLLPSPPSPAQETRTVTVKDMILSLLFFCFVNTLLLVGTPTTIKLYSTMRQLASRILN